MSKQLKDSSHLLHHVEGEYLVYEKAWKEESLFLSIAEETLAGIDEPSSWKKAKDPSERQRGRPIEYKFKSMFLVLMLMARERKGYREMESHLRTSPRLLKQLALEKAPSKSTIHSSASRIGLDTLAEFNYAIGRRFEKIFEGLERTAWQWTRQAKVSSGRQRIASALTE